MNMKERLLDDLKTAMREKDVLRKDMLQILRAAVLQVEKDTRQTVDENGIFEILAKELKKRTDMVKELENSGRQDIIDKNLAEIALIEAYMPRQLSESEIEQLVRQAITATGACSARDMGAVMKQLMPEVKGRADGKLVNLIVRRLLS
ncbi:MAG: GatB/YqeY domain-containing protein [Clostridiaceae bacterium]|nr:GatB/YqeY domain-containing protein [Clostridiaceae bacterium]